MATAAVCHETPATRNALLKIAQELQVQGLSFKATCATVASGWIVHVQVLDGMKASRVVRGPLADGYAVDMGTPAGVGGSSAQGKAGGFSPDVQHNRQWLRALMARYHFDNLPDAWWHFAQHGAAPVQTQGAGTDLAVH